MSEQLKLDDILQQLKNLSEKMTSQAQTGKFGELDNMLTFCLRNLEVTLRDSPKKLSSEQISLLRNHILALDETVRSSIRELSSRINVASSYDSVRISTTINEQTKVASSLRAITERLETSKAG